MQVFMERQDDQPKRILGKGSKQKTRRKKKRQKRSKKKRRIKKRKIDSIKRKIIAKMQKIHPPKEQP